VRNNDLLTTWKAGGSAIGLWLTLPDPNSAETLGSADANYLTIDLQHGLIDYAEARAILQATQRSASVPILRVPWNEPGIISKALDAGAMGVIIPMVNSVAEAEQAVSSCFYAPKGTRSHGPVRAAGALGPGYAAEANDQIACIPMIETVQAVERIDQILEVPGIDAIYVGPADLSRTMGLPPGPGHDNQEFNDALATVVVACDKAGVAPGIHSTPSLVKTRLQQGFRMVTATSDMLALVAGATAALETARGESGQTVPSPAY